MIPTVARMELDLLPATVYQPPRSGPDPTAKLNTIIEEETIDVDINGEGSTPRLPFGKAEPRPVSSDLGRLAGDAPNACQPRSPCLRSSSPSSSVDSRPVTWTSSGHASTTGSGTDFEDLYEPAGLRVSKDDAAFVPLMLVEAARETAGLVSPIQPRPGSMDSAPRYPSLTILAEYQESPEEAKHQHPLSFSPTRPSQIPLSPAALSLLIPAPAPTSALPSLDGSLTSDQLAGSEAPVTPPSDSPELLSRSWGSGVQLNDEALATLNTLARDEHYQPSAASASSGGPSALPEPAATDPVVIKRRTTLERRTPSTGHRLPHLTRLDIPSPTGFFSSLTVNTRHTWCFPSAHPPSSTTAERFYQCPWIPLPERTVERVVEVTDSDTDGPSTAQLITPRPAATQQPPRDKALSDEEERGGHHVDRDLQPYLPSPSSALDRTARWLSAQMESPEPSLHASAGPSAIGASEQLERADLILPERSPSLRTAPDPDRATLTPPPMAWPVATRRDVSHCHRWEVFLCLVRMACATDAFVHCQPRFDAIQSRRVCAPAAHRAQLLGKYPADDDDDARPRPWPLPLPSPWPSPPPSWEDEHAVGHERPAQASRERAMLQQMSAAHWSIMAAKFLNGGQLLASPATQLITRRSVSAPGTLLSRASILDLGGQPVCDWGWHCADAYPMSKIYTAVPVGGAERAARGPCAGPHNHYHVATPHLWRLPFLDEHFEVIWTRNLFTFLKTAAAAAAAPGAAASAGADDEYDRCLRECWRCLKPGGYLEFFVMDAELVNAGPLGAAMSVEFAVSLKTRGYDPAPTRPWLRRLRNAGFRCVKRTWTFLPMGAPPPSHQQQEAAPPPTTDAAGPGRAPPRAAASSTHAIAAVSGLVGLRAWESWMLRLQMECGRPDHLLLEGVAAVVREGRCRGSGWRCLTGWARKPVAARKSVAARKPVAAA
ncbi:MAG: hypothetical protein M1826_005727 [Phylliscum demangeonii]|nr:MAG: hypothetical protein M1826_005727 [Phylliscum demangeonii]